ncbi:MAG: hypothetical protein M1823_008920, partial [Watsoniomyces obsoletus]
MAAIQAAGGRTMVITPNSPRGPGMPENAIGYDGPIDNIGSVQEIAQAISTLRGHLRRTGEMSPWRVAGGCRLEALAAAAPLQVDERVSGDLGLEPGAALAQESGYYQSPLSTLQVAMTNHLVAVLDCPSLK